MENVTEEKKPTLRDIRRAALIKLSDKAREIREEAGAEEYLNDIIIREFYQKDGHEEFHLLSAWNELGYKVKKGSKAFTIWGRKRKKEADPEAQGEEAKTYEFFPLAYLFSNLQVEKEK